MDEVFFVVKQLEIEKRRFLSLSLFFFFFSSVSSFTSFLKVVHIYIRISIQKRKEWGRMPQSFLVE